ncbi:MAG: tRNA (adenosine(37)-N6)-threonylcarbamoyltransferase complex dimerization subunit type 1 TsaB [Nitrospirae bacterium]|nr:tRNA (adenosine(37)-N6)-threonylcarbamoyltransferase complex dimerization subunit type 1 TsaB [Nitrospirota bacterium]
MRLLAIETSTMLGGIAVMEDDTLIAESRMNVKSTHSGRIMAGIDAALGTAGLTIDAIDVFGIASGPGSFTGLRVGLSTVKGLSYATGKRVVSVSTLEAFAWNVPFSQYLVCPLLDARKKEVYAGVFRWSENGFTKVIEEQTIKIDALLSAMGESVIFLGEGSLLYKDRIQASLGEKAFFAAPQDMVPSPANVAYLCMTKARNNFFDDPVRLVPRYIRKSEAEIKNSRK